MIQRKTIRYALILMSAVLAASILWAGPAVVVADDLMPPPPCFPQFAGKNQERLLSSYRDRQMAIRDAVGLRKHGWPAEVREEYPWYRVYLVSGPCYKNNLFVLLPDQEGKIGRILIKNSAGTQTVSQAFGSAGFDKAGEAPTAQSKLSRDELNTLFGKALSAEPIQPVRYLLYYQSGCSDLQHYLKALMPSVLKTITGRKEPEVSVVGHTDRAGSEESNLKLSEERANTVHDYLVTHGVDAGIVKVLYFGETQPQARTRDGVPERRNRRVEIIIR